MYKQNRKRLLDIENKLVVMKGEREGRVVNKGYGVSRRKPLCMK